MFTAMIVVFIIGYIFIAMEHPFHINKSATALLLASVLWVMGVNYLPEAHNHLVDHLGEVAEILFFLMGAMTIVEIVDSYGGFRIITDKISTTKKTSLLWIIAFITFFMSAVLDNLTTSIVMIALLRKLIGEKKDRWFFAGIVILAANAGGAWSPIGDVTTIMLWIANKVSSVHIIETTLLASLASLLVPVIVLSFTMKGNVKRPETSAKEAQEAAVSFRERLLVLCLGVGALVFVPIFKTITHLPPYLGMLGGLAVLWIVTGFLCKRKPQRDNSHLSVNYILSRIDVPSILFFLGILMAVNSLATCGQLAALSASLDKIPLVEPTKYYVINVIIGVLSSIIDNVPLVAGAMKMYDFPMDNYFWAFLAYTAGTGGSILIIGSAAGVAVMGMEKIDFIWYLKKISWLALLGYLAGCAVYIVQETLMGVA
ncbi:MAG: sodium:proton antiporter NhaD [Dysgonamonadaceae bacterium]|jgi:Na+/H+ antiporter NhaD/arsenite permease-like protein|nr:sodium:proton antiporter NhaD [Dysgonamonadaceae bacterium]